MEIKLKRVLEIRNAEEKGIRIEQYACEIAGEEFDERSYKAGVKRSLIAEIIEPRPISDTKRDAKYILHLLVSCDESTLWNFVQSDYQKKWPGLEIV